MFAVIWLCVQYFALPLLYPVYISCQQSAILADSGATMPVMNDIPAAEYEPRWSRLSRRFVGVVYLLLLPVGGVLAMSSAFATDAPGSMTSPLTNLFIWTLLFLPLTLLSAGVWGIWSSFRRSTPRRARLHWLVLVLPVLNVFAFLIVFVLIEVMCSGSFVCHPW